LAWKRARVWQDRTEGSGAMREEETSERKGMTRGLGRLEEEGDLTAGTHVLVEEVERGVPLRALIPGGPWTSFGAGPNGSPTASFSFLNSFSFFFYSEF
jgi:hypothetical protein